MRTGDSQFGMTYLDAEESARYLDANCGHVLGVIGFGRPVALPPLACAPLWVDIPVLGASESALEVWTSNAAVSACEYRDMRGCCDGRVLFGSLSLPQQAGDTLEMLAEQAYVRLFAFIDHFGYGNLLRVWHYFPQINNDENGLERYRSFNVGRYAAFLSCGRSIDEEHMPAASALGSNSGALVIYFMAAKQRGTAVENPRQVSAYRYPEHFGPRTPIFVRAMAANPGGQECFFISGTASIVGYETLHQGDSEKQSAETLRNIRALLQQFPHYGPAQGRMRLKAYVRHAADFEMLRSKVQSEFGAECQAVYLLSDICRSDLLLEIEGAYFSSAA